MGVGVGVGFDSCVVVGVGAVVCFEVLNVFVFLMLFCFNVVGKRGGFGLVLFQWFLISFLMWFGLVFSIGYSLSSLFVFSLLAKLYCFPFGVVYIRSLSSQDVFSCFFILLWIFTIPFVFMFSGLAISLNSFYIVVVFVFLILFSLFGLMCVGSLFEFLLFLLVFQVV